jgi:hypothetical protein
MVFDEPGIIRFNGEVVDQFDPEIAGDYTFTYIETNEFGCSDSCEFIITVNPLPAVFAGFDQTITEGSSTIIADANATGTAPLSYSWSPADLLVDPYVIHPTTVDLYDTTTFTLIVTDGNGCINSDEMIIAVHEALPDTLQAITGPDDLCLGNAANVPVRVNRFIDVANFQLKLSYNVEKLNCEGYINSHPQIESNLTVI